MIETEHIRPGLTQEPEMYYSIRVMGRFSALCLILLQASLFIGPLCGVHAGSAESMDCCKHGMMSPTSMQDPTISSCCSRCDMGKHVGVSAKFQKSILNIHSPSLNSLSIQTLRLAESREPVSQMLESRWTFQKFISESPPEIILLKTSFLI